MTQEEKLLLLKDLCSRMPYGVKVITSVGGEIRNDKEQLNFAQLSLFEAGHEDIKPYLIPLEKLPQEKRDEYDSLLILSSDDIYYDTIKSINWCYENHVDINGLIDSGLAIDATGLNIY